ncbi:hypothetical protein BVAVS116_E0058 (plasmid) [Borreliella valaisiana VS116]|uniref:Uncharacterized protein n=1 Tax=Borreliella valaisiana VS116 TaxID=445987 RepID=C0R8T9_BORVA|nr:hypothetical protein BVAVS116_E0058 [Borreliella valaisiana VS116]
MKKFLQQLHVILKSINDYTLASFSSLNLKKFPNLSQKQERTLEYMENQLYINFLLQ